MRDPYHIILSIALSFDVDGEGRDRIRPRFRVGVGLVSSPLLLELSESELRTKKTFLGLGQWTQIRVPYEDARDCKLSLYHNRDIS